MTTQAPPPFSADDERFMRRALELARHAQEEHAEVPVGGPLSLVPRRLALAAAYPRNRECLARLAALAERRKEPE